MTTDSMGSIQPARASSPPQATRRKRLPRPIVPREPAKQLVMMGVIFLGILGVFFGTHYWLESRYKLSARSIILPAVEQYLLRLDEKEEALGLYVGGMPLAQLQGSEQAGPLGINRMASLRALLAEYNQRAVDYGRQVTGRLSNALASLEREGGTDFYSAPLPAFGIEGQGGRIFFSARDVDELRSRYSLKSVPTAHRLLLGSRVLQDGEAMKPLATRNGDSVPPAVERAVREIETASLRLASFKVPRLRPLSDLERDGVNAWVGGLYEGSGGQDGVAAQGVPQGERDSAPGAARRDPSSRLNASVALLNGSLKERAVNVVENELCNCFWLLGCWRWWEIVFWTLFGVMVKALFDLSGFLVGQQKTIFQPRESLRVFSRLLYAPLLSLAFFWLATATNLVSGPSFLSDQSFGILAVAFLLGMYPNMIYRLLTGILEKILQGGALPPAREKPLVPGKVRVPAGRAGSEGPDFSKLRERIADMFTAPLQPATIPPARSIERET